MILGQEMVRLSPTILSEWGLHGLDSEGFFLDPTYGAPFWGSAGVFASNLQIDMTFPIPIHLWSYGIFALHEWLKLYDK